MASQEVIQRLGSLVESLVGQSRFTLLAFVFLVFGLAEFLKAACQGHKKVSVISRIVPEIPEGNGRKGNC